MNTSEVRERLEVWESTYPQLYAAWDQMRDLIEHIEGEPKSDLDAPAIPGKTETSNAAALKLMPSVGTIRRRVLDYVRLFSAMPNPGVTCSELVIALNSRHQTISGRPTELKDGGWIEWTGETRDNERGFAEQIYVGKP